MQIYTTGTILLGHGRGWAHTAALRIPHPKLARLSVRHRPSGGLAAESRERGGEGCAPRSAAVIPSGRKALQGRAALPADACPRVPLGQRQLPVPRAEPSRAPSFSRRELRGGRDSSEPGAAPGQRLPLPFIAASTKHIICQGRSGGARSGAARSGAERGGGGQEAGRAGPGPGREPPQQQPPPAASAEAEAEPRRAAIPRPSRGST